MSETWSERRGDVHCSLGSEDTAKGDEGQQLPGSVSTSGLCLSFRGCFVRALKEELVTGSQIRIMQNKGAFM